MNELSNKLLDFMKKEDNICQDCASKVHDFLLNNQPMTVREAFSKAFAEVPEGASCYGQSTHFDDLEPISRPMIMLEGQEYNHPKLYGGMWIKSDADCCGPEISGHSVSLYLGKFGNAYDRVVQEDK